MISAWANNANLVLGQLKVNEKANEITAIPHQRERDYKDYPFSYFKKSEYDHGRVDVREYWTTSSIKWLEEKKDWKGLTAIGCARLSSTIGDKTTVYDRYYILSHDMDAKSFGKKR